MPGHEHGAAGLVEADLTQVGAVQVHGGVGVAGEDVEQRRRVGGLQRDHDPTCSPAATSTASPSGSRTRSAPAGCAGSVPVPSATAGGAASSAATRRAEPRAPASTGPELGEPFERPDQELRQPDPGHELADADRAVEREAAADPGHDHEEQPGDHVGGPEVAALQAGGGEPGAQRGAARRAVGLGRGRARPRSP